MYILSFKARSGRRCAVRYGNAKICYVTGDFEARRNPESSPVMYRKKGGELIRLWNFRR